MCRHVRVKFFSYSFCPFFHNTHLDFDTEMSSSNTATQPKIQDKPLEEEPAKKNGQLGALEEDDEFEEFEAEGKNDKKIYANRSNLFFFRLGRKR